VTDSALSSLLPWAWKFAAGAAWVAAVAILAFVLAHWFWQWFAPQPAPIPRAAPQSDLARRIGDAKLFGAARAPAMGATPSTGAADLRLLGIISEADGRGYALFRAGARGPLLIAAGHDIADGVRLEAVRPDGVTLVDGVTRRDLPLRNSPAAERPRPAIAAAGGRPSACAAPPGFTGAVVKLNAELLGGMIDAPGAWKTLLEAGGGALIVRDQSGYAGMLGLKNGDRVESANGIALAIPEDVASTVLQPLTRSQPVWVTGSRGGKQQQWLYLNAGACPG